MKRITSIGEILFDIYPATKKIGGAPFNFIYHIIKLTGQGSIISRVGDDENGREILSFLKEHGIPSEYIQVDTKYPTGLSIANLDQNKIPHWTIKENSAYDFIELNNEIESHINQNTDCLYFGTLAQRRTTSRTTIKRLFNKNIKHLCDLNIRQNFYSIHTIEETLKAADVLKLNLDELKLLNDLLYGIHFKQDDVVKRISEQYNLELISVTMGEDGAIIYAGDKKNECRISVNDIVDTVGAGDAYASILCIGYLNNWDIEKINLFASEFAARITKIYGALPVNDDFYNNFKDKIK